MSRRRHSLGCECGLAACVAAYADADHHPGRGWVLNRFETMLFLRDAVVQVSARMARVEADGMIMVLALTPRVQSLLSTAGKLPALEWGGDAELQPVTCERNARRGDALC